MMQIGFKCSQSLIERLIADARVWRRNVSVTRILHDAQCGSRGIVLVFHHGDRVFDRTERPTRQGSLSCDRRIHIEDVRKEDAFLLHQMYAQFLSETLKYLSNP